MIPQRERATGEIPEALTGSEDLRRQVTTNVATIERSNGEPTKYRSGADVNEATRFSIL